MSKQKGDESAFGVAPGSTPAFISAHDNDLARDMACFLWECSRLRHGLFTPPEFIPLVSERLREYLTQRKPNAGDVARPGNNLKPKE